MAKRGKGGRKPPKQKKKKKKGNKQRSDIKHRDQRDWERGHND